MNLQKIKNIEDLKLSISEGEINTFSKAIRAKCLDCCAYEMAEINKCSIVTCPLHAFRKGKRLKAVLGEND